MCSWLYMHHSIIAATEANALALAFECYFQLKLITYLLYKEWLLWTYKHSLQYLTYKHLIIVIVLWTGGNF